MRRSRNYSRGSTKPSSALGQKKSTPTRSIRLFHSPSELPANAEGKPPSKRYSPYAYITRVLRGEQKVDGQVRDGESPAQCGLRVLPFGKVGDTPCGSGSAPSRRVIDRPRGGP